MAGSMTSMADRTDAWTQAARQVRQEAAHLGLNLDDEELILQDVRDLRGLYARLHSKRIAPARSIRAALHELPWTA